MCRDSVLDINTMLISQFTHLRMKILRQLIGEAFRYDCYHHQWANSAALDIC